MQRSSASRAAVLTFAVAGAGCFATSAALAANAALGASVSPLQQVVTMLEGMLETGREEKQQDEVQYSSYRQWCSMTITQLNRDIDLAGNRIETLQGAKEYHESQLNEHREALANLETHLAEWAAALQTGQEQRDSQREDYAAIHEKYTDALRVISQAIELVRNQNQAHGQAEVAGLLQASKLLMSMSQEGKVSPLLLQLLSTNEQAPDQVEPNAYEFQSDSILEAMEALKAKFTEERAQQETEEQNTRNTFALVKQDYQSRIAQGEHEKSQLEQDEALHSQILRDTVAEKAGAERASEADKSYVKEVESNCAHKAELFDLRQQRRVEEIESLNRAITILSDDINGHIVQPAAGEALAVLRATVNVQSDPATGDARKRRVAELLRVKAQATHDTELSALAQRVLDDPLEKVRELIDELIASLEKQAAEDTTHEEWCQGELQREQELRDSKEEQVLRKTEDIHAKGAEIAVLGEQLQELTQTVAEITAAVASEQEMRTNERAINEATIDDATNAKDAVERAITVLKEFYEGTAPAQFLQLHERTKQDPEEGPANEAATNEADEAVTTDEGANNAAAEEVAGAADDAANAETTAETDLDPAGGGAAADAAAAPIIQPETPEGARTSQEPEIFEHAYTGNAGSDHVLATLDMLMGQFESLISTTQAAETRAQELHDDFVANSQSTTDANNADITEKTALRETRQAEVDAANADIANLNVELQSEYAELEALQKTCTAGVTHEERAAQRQDEIDSLREALAILSGPEEAQT